MSVEAVQVRLACVLDVAAATRFEGAVGGVESAAAEVVAEAMFE